MNLSGTENATARMEFLARRARGGAWGHACGVHHLYLTHAWTTSREQAQLASRDQ